MGFKSYQLMGFLILGLCIASNLCSCEPERIPLDAPIVNIYYTIHPDTGVITKRDTFYLSFELSSVIIDKNGKQTNVVDGEFDIAIAMKKYDLSETGSVWSLPLASDCYTFPVLGRYIPDARGGGVKSIEPVYINGKYLFKMGFVPLKKDTFWIEVDDGGYLHSTQMDAVLTGEFSETQLNHELVSGFLPYISSTLPADIKRAKGTFAFQSID